MIFINLFVIIICCHIYSCFFPNHLNDDTRHQTVKTKYARFFFIEQYTDSREMLHLERDQAWVSTIFSKI